MKPRRYRWWQWALVGLTILVLAWMNVQVWTSIPSPGEVADQAIGEVRKAIEQQRR